MKRNKEEIIVGAITVLAVLVISSSLVLADKDVTGSGAPSGKHFTLNIIGVKEGHEKDMDPEDCGKGHRIFVKLGQAEDEKKGQSAKNARTVIKLFEAPEGESFAVLDCDGTDGEARLQLENPDPGDGSLSTRYSVFIRALGKPGGVADVNVCATYDDPCDPGEPTEYCGDVITLRRLKGQEKKDAGTQKFQNVSKELLTVCVLVWDPVKGEYDWERLYIFDERLRDELWNYDNKGLKHAQIRFYWIPTDYTVDEWSCK